MGYFLDYFWANFEPLIGMTQRCTIIDPVLVSLWTTSVHRWVIFGTGLHGYLRGFVSRAVMGLRRRTCRKPTPDAHR